MGDWWFESCITYFTNINILFNCQTIISTSFNIISIFYFEYISKAIAQFCLNFIKSFESNQIVIKNERLIKEGAAAGLI